jgi:hypothetical protein
MGRAGRSKTERRKKTTIIEIFHEKAIGASKEID